MSNPAIKNRYTGAIIVEAGKYTNIKEAWEGNKMIIASVANHMWALESLEDATTLLNIMGRATQVEQDFNLPRRFRETGGDDYRPHVEITLIGGDVMKYADAMAELEGKKKAKVTEPLSI